MLLLDLQSFIFPKKINKNILIVFTIVRLNKVFMLHFLSLFILTLLCEMLSGCCYGSFC